jgi:flagellar biosynthesis protein FlhF
LRVKKFTGVEMPEILEKIREELGPDAVILSTRKIAKGEGSFGMFSRQLLEVTAAADLDIDKPKAPMINVPPPRTMNPYQEKNPYQERDTYQEKSRTQDNKKAQGMFLSLQAEIDSLREELAVVGGVKRNQDIEPLAKSIKSLETKIDRLNDNTARIETLGLSPKFRELSNRLEDMDLDAALGARIFGYLQKKFEEGAIKEGNEEAALAELITRTVKTSEPVKKEGKKVWAFVGPTGVGKTTTVAKLAARMALEEGMRVGLITVDTYRIAAVEQLRTYANIMDVPLRVALGPEDFKDAVKEYENYDIILVDTAGQSPRDEAALGELLKMFPPEVNTMVHLVLSVTTRTRDLENIMKHYSPVKAQRLVLTKLDETQCHGPLLQLPVVSKLELAFMTTGQNVPDDLEGATPEKVASYLLGKAVKSRQAP